MAQKYQFLVELDAVRHMNAKVLVELDTPDEKEAERRALSMASDEVDWKCTHGNENVEVRSIERIE